MNKERRYDASIYFNPLDGLLENEKRTNAGKYIHGKYLNQPGLSDGIYLISQSPDTLQKMRNNKNRESIKVGL